MDINFKSIRIKRFRSFQNEAILEFASAGPGLYFLKGKNQSGAALGSNGAGKSSVIDALMWCLYGKTVRGLTNAHIVPWSGKGATEVEVVVEVASKIKRIQRALNPNLLTVDGTEVGQDYIGTLIPIPMGIIPYTIVLGQKQPLFFDLTASEKLKVFSECLNLERWEERSAHASNIVKGLESEIQSKENEATGYTRQLAIFEDDLEKFKQHSKLWENDRSLKLASAEKDIEDFKKEIAAIMPERDTADLMLERALMELKVIGPDLDRLYKNDRDFAKEIIKNETEIDKLTDINNELSGKLSSLDDEKCPTCKQALKTKKILDTMKTDIRICINMNTSLIQGLSEVEATLREEHKKTLIAIKAQEEALAKFNDDKDEAGTILNKLEVKIAGREASIKFLNMQLAEKESLNNPHTEQIQLLRKRKNQTEISIEDAQKVITTKREYCERVRPWVKWFKDIKLLQVEEILQELQLVTNMRCSEFGLEGWSVEYDIERETKSGGVARGLNITIISPNNKKSVKWESWSGGESQRLRILGSMALSSVLLNHVGVTTNLFILDEPTESLSSEGVRDLVDLLAQYAKEVKRNVWLVDHHTVSSNKFISEVTIIKDGSGSRVDVR